LFGRANASEACVGPTRGDVTRLGTLWSSEYKSCLYWVHAHCRNQSSAPHALSLTTKP
jgi:hypothetical protein